MTTLLRLGVRNIATRVNDLCSAVERAVSTKFRSVGLANSRVL